MTTATLQPSETSTQPQTPSQAGAALDSTQANANPQTLSILSLVSALLGIVLGLVIPLSIAAIVLGVLALSREPKARTMAIWGISLGAVPTVLALFAGLIAVAFFVPLTAFGILGGF